ncbi:hypothetical protein J4226_02470 [Candidatus Pacearchaeota archaeon]|nr:hypothetical protein [Candidatus Pacearchaeota archaeon]
MKIENFHLDGSSQGDGKAHASHGWPMLRIDGSSLGSGAWQGSFSDFDKLLNLGGSEK